MLQQNLYINARAVIRGDDENPRLHGEVRFRQAGCFVLVTASITGLPGKSSQFYAFHLHEGESCDGKDFSGSGGHYNPEDAPHPQHSGDLPPLLSYGSSAYLSFRTNRFTVRELIGRTVVIHSGTDDFRTQPSGDSGRKIACGVIRRV